ncbi:hypothetical protein B7P43_G14464 [Cryptotermes secundus]|uniref:SCAP beta-propeller domain-containing protein n=3 Tax=Cryptotermes secundus TaxID=105785 RepID=A0A2J7RR92_9NEOP|nr:hypothetical protein B7P43_G14464 [Cryptotermes secundus]
MEAVPLVLDGHPQEVECLATDGCVVVSSCLGGQLRVWDSVSGEALAVVNRRHYFLAKQGDSDVSDPGEVLLSGCESGSPPSCWEKMGMVDNCNSSPPLLHHTCSRRRTLADLRPTINMNFTGNRPTDYDASNPYRHVHRSGCDFTVSCEDLHDVLTHPMDSDSDEDGIWNVTTLKQSKPNKPTPHLQYTVPLPTKQFSEDLVSKSCLCQCQGLVDKCGITQQRRFSGHVEHCDGGTLGSKCSDSVVLCYSSHHEDTCPRRWKETEFCDIACGGNSISLTTGHSLPVNTDSPSRAIDVDRRQCHAFCHKSPPKEAVEICGERGPTVDIVQQRPPIWCLDCHENLIAVGCANGRLEFWEGTTATFKCLFQDGSGVGVTAVKIIGNRVVAAKLSGSVDFLELKSYSHGRQMDWGFTAYRRTHVRSGSTGSIVDWDSIMSCKSNDEDLRCIRLNTTRAHQQPITVLDSEGGRVLTGSKDHTLKVFRLEDQLPLYTLHGHCGPITCLFIDRISPMMSGSGSQDGLLCVWDLLTGACMYSLQAHDGSVTALTYSASYVISLGTDERLCVWERFQGHLLNTIQVSHTYCSSMVMFTHNLLITSKQGSLVVWDVRTGDPVRVVKLGHCDGSVFVKQILLLRDSVACDYGNQLRIVHFPLVVTDKCE